MKNKILLALSLTFISTTTSAGVLCSDAKYTAACETVSSEIRRQGGSCYKATEFIDAGLGNGSVTVTCESAPVKINFYNAKVNDDKSITIREEANPLELLGIL